MDEDRRNAFRILKCAERWRRRCDMRWRAIDLLYLLLFLFLFLYFIDVQNPANLSETESFIQFVIDSPEFTPR